MTSRPLRICPTCRRELDEPTRAAMGLRNGELLNTKCPGRNGPSDIDHVLHNAWHKPAPRIVFFEYKSWGDLTGGQRILAQGLSGDWQEPNTGRLLSIRYASVGLFDAAADDKLNKAVDWLWPRNGAP